MLGLLALAGALAVAQDVDAPNVVPIAPDLLTSGQPTAQALASLGKLGFQAVIYLAPGTVADAVEAEPRLLAAQGIEFIHLPVPFDAPQESHFLALSAALQRLKGRKVLVHCQINLRASSLVFLHRVIKQHESPQRAYEAVEAVWSPRGPWRALLVEQLAKHGIAFRPY